MLQEGYKEAMDKYNFNTYLVHTNSLTSRMLDDKEDFQCIYTDDTASIYKKLNFIEYYFCYKTLQISLVYKIAKK